MVSLDLSKGTTIYYDIESKIIGRKPSPSNLKEQGSDNSIYLGIVGNYSDEILCSIFEIEDINEFSSRDYKMNFYGNEVDISCNINNGKQIQIKVNGDGHMYKLLSKYKNNINPNVDENNILILFDFNKEEIYFNEIDDNNIKYDPKVIKKEEKELEDIVNEAKRNIIDESIDVNGYIETQINIRNSAVQKRFRDNLMIEFNGKCAICNINKKELLRASHILPYSKCPTVNEMIDYNNGLLLCVTHDELFDKGLISFDYYTGKIKIVSNQILDKKLYELLNINENIVLDKKYITEKRTQYLATHKLKEK